MNLPQSVTDRYVRNLLSQGQNNDNFRIQTMARDIAMVDDVVVGEYYKIYVGFGIAVSKCGVGVTPLEALRAALTRHGVTFR